MSNQSINISLKSIFWILIPIGIIVLLIAILDNIDNSNKYKQYKSLYENLLKSDYPERFSNLTNINSLGDSSSILILKQTLELLEEDYHEFNYSEIYVPEAGYYYHINADHYRDNWKKIPKVKYIPINIKKFISYLEKYPNPNIDSLFSLTKQETRLDIVLKVGNGYLHVSYNRD